MYVIAETIGCRVSEVERWPMAELLEWCDYLASKGKKPEQSPADMLAIAKRISRSGRKTAR